MMYYTCKWWLILYHACKVVGTTRNSWLTPKGCSVITLDYATNQKYRVVGLSWDMHISSTFFACLEINQPTYLKVLTDSKKISQFLSLGEIWLQYEELPNKSLICNLSSLSMLSYGVLTKPIPSKKCLIVESKYFLIYLRQITSMVGS